MRKTDYMAEVIVKDNPWMKESLKKGKSYQDIFDGIDCIIDEDDGLRISLFDLSCECLKRELKKLKKVIKAEEANAIYERNHCND